MRSRELLPWAGDKKARDAWDEVFSREVLGAVILGSATGKLVENIIALFVEGGPTVWSYIFAWSIALVVGIAIFVRWHAITDTASETAEQTVEKASEAADMVTDGDG